MNKIIMIRIIFKHSFFKSKSEIKCFLNLDRFHSIPIFQAKVLRPFSLHQVLINRDNLFNGSINTLKNFSK